MKNTRLWQPSKFVYRNGKLRASRDPRHVGIGSRVMADSVARLYDEHLKTFACGRLIDLGCGQVPLFHVYRDLISEHVCADWTNTGHKNGHLDYECDLTQPLPFEDARFETIILSDVLEHVPEPALLWSEMARLLVSSGNVIMNVPFYYWIHERPYDFYRYTEYALKRLAENAGFRVVLLEPFGGAPEIIADVVSKNLLELPVVGATLARVVQACTGAFVSTKLGRKVSRATGENFPLGYFMVATRA